MKNPEKLTDVVLSVKDIEEAESSKHEQAKASKEDPFNNSKNN
jgi:hypothetical protein